MKLKFHLVLCFVFMLAPSLFAEPEAGSAPKTTDSKVPQILAKLDQVLKNQETILEKLKDLKEEVGIVKVRATR